MSNIEFPRVFIKIVLLIIKFSKNWKFKFLNSFLNNLKIKGEYDEKLVNITNQQTRENNELKLKIDVLETKYNQASKKLKEIKKYHEKVGFYVMLLNLLLYSVQK